MHRTINCKIQLLRLAAEYEDFTLSFLITGLAELFRIFFSTTVIKYQLRYFLKCVSGSSGDLKCENAPFYNDCCMRVPMCVCLDMSSISGWGSLQSNNQ